jgi:hypothetical protein
LQEKKQEVQEHIPQKDRTEKLIANVLNNDNDKDWLFKDKARH